MKLSLSIQNGMLAGRVFELTEGFLTIGRSENCAIRFDPLTEKIASKQHAYVEAKPDGFYLIDNQSTNGTLLNKEKIQTAKLHSGDRVQFGTNGIEATVNIEENAPVNQSVNLKPPGQPRVESLSQPASQISQSPLPDWKNSISGISLPNIQETNQPSQAGKYVGIAIAIFAVVFLSFIVALLMFASVGIGAAIIASVVAFVPAMFYLLPVMWLDRSDPEPLWLLASAFAWGALVSVIVSFIVNTLIGAIAGDLVGGIISAPIFEEGSKGLGLVILLIFFRRYFDDILDGIIFAGVIALGFATVENVLYYGGEIANGGSSNLIVLFVLRGIMSPFAHVSFTSMTGIGCGISRESHNKIVRVIMPILGYGCAVLLHAFWNTLAFVGGLGGFIAGYIVLEIPFFLIFVGFAFYILRRQNKILREMLAIDVVRGVLPQEHLDIAASSLRSSMWILGSIFNGKFKARNRYIRAISKLGLTYWHIQRATAAHGHTGSFQQNPLLRDEVLKWREQV